MANQTANFERLYAEYLKARSKVIWGGWKEGEHDKNSDKLDQAFWEVVTARAYKPFKIDYKFEMLREVIDADWSDGRHRAMVESIRRDLMDAWEDFEIAKHK